MEVKFFHGPISPKDIADALVARFHRGNYQVQQVGEKDEFAVQIATPRMVSSGGHTALSVFLKKHFDGITVTIGQQAWWGIAASLGYSALTVLRNPLNLLSRLDDIAQDIESIQLSTDVWQVIEATCLSIGSGFELSSRLKRYTCDYCSTANPPGEPRCIACGAPLGDVQPDTCMHCGFVITKGESVCPNCRTPVIQTK